VKIPPLGRLYQDKALGTQKAQRKKRKKHKKPKVFLFGLFVLVLRFLCSLPLILLT
jgi:hypothetical protein